MIRYGKIENQFWEDKHVLAILVSKTDTHQRSVSNEEVEFNALTFPPGG